MAGRSAFSTCRRLENFHTHPLRQLIVAGLAGTVRTPDAHTKRGMGVEESLHSSVGSWPRVGAQERARGSVQRPGRLCEAATACAPRRFSTLGLAWPLRSSSFHPQSAQALQSQTWRILKPPGGNVTEPRITCAETAYSVRRMPPSRRPSGATDSDRGCPGTACFFAKTTRLLAVPAAPLHRRRHARRSASRGRGSQL